VILKAGAVIASVLIVPILPSSETANNQQYTAGISPRMQIPRDSN
jgi:hypothetical protein